MSYMDFPITSNTKTKIERIFCLVDYSSSKQHFISNKYLATNLLTIKMNENMKNIKYKNEN